MNLPKIVSFPLTLIVLSLLDIFSTAYALKTYPSLAEGNVFMNSLISSSYYIFVIVKMFSVCVIIGMYRHIQKKNELLSRIGKTCIIFLMVLVLGNNLIQISAAVDNQEYLPTCIENSYDSGYIFQLTSNNATGGKMWATDITSGYFSPSNSRLSNGINVLCVKSDPTSYANVSTQNRLFGTDELGNVFWWDSPILFYDDGFYSVADPSNPLYKIGELSATTMNRKIAIDSSGNVYIADGANIYQYRKQLFYAQALFYTLVETTDYTPAYIEGFSSNRGFEVLDLETHTNGLHVLIGTFGESVTAPNTVINYISKITIGYDGIVSSRSKNISNQTRTTTGESYTYASMITGGMILDSQNPNTNYTFGYGYRIVSEVHLPPPTYNANTVYLFHNSSSGQTSIGNMAGLTSISALGYYESVIYLASPLQNLIRSFSTPYLGYIQPESPPSELSYDIASVYSIYDAYYNNSEVEVFYDLAYEIPKSANSTEQYNRISQGLRFLDPDGINVASYSIPKKCVEDEGSWLDIPRYSSFSCASSGTVSFSTRFAWKKNGTWEVDMVEIPSQSTLDTDYFLIYANETGQVVIPQPLPDLTSGENADSIGMIDDWVTWLTGMPLSDVSKLLFALIITVSIAIIFLAVTKNGDIAALMAFAPYIFFTYILYIPKWIFIIVVILVIVHAKVFR